jgi:hypothetical protein
MRIGLMGWLLFLLPVAIGVPFFMWSYRRRLDVLKGPWIIGESAQDSTKAGHAPAASVVYGFLTKLE